MCLSVDCPTKKGPEIYVGKCPDDGADLHVRYSQVGARYVRCDNYDPKTHPISFPLPQNGELESTEEVCEPCGSPRVIVHTKKGPWKICLDPDCETKPKRNARGGKGDKKATGKTAKAKPKKASGKSAKGAAKKESDGAAAGKDSGPRPDGSSD